jgi:hypothetical protein
MAPSATEVEQPQAAIPVHPGKQALATGIKAEKPWLKSTGVLDSYENFDITPIIGREFANVDLVEWLQAENSDELLKELALTSMYMNRNGHAGS